MNRPPYLDRDRIYFYGSVRSDIITAEKSNEGSVLLEIIDGEERCSINLIGCVAQEFAKWILSPPTGVEAT